MFEYTVQVWVPVVVSSCDSSIMHTTFRLPLYVEVSLIRDYGFYMSMSMLRLFYIEHISDNIK